MRKAIHIGRKDAAKAYSLRLLYQRAIVLLGLSLCLFSQSASAENLKALMNFSGFRNMVLAIGIVNQAMYSAAENPMDDSRRLNLQNAFRLLPQAMVGLAKEFKKGNLHDDDLVHIQKLLGGFVAVNAADNYMKFAKNPTKDLIPKVGSSYPQEWLKQPKEAVGAFGGTLVADEGASKKSSGGIFNADLVELTGVSYQSKAASQKASITMDESAPKQMTEAEKARVATSDLEKDIREVESRLKAFNESTSDSAQVSFEPVSASGSLSVERADSDTASQAADLKTAKPKKKAATQKSLKKVEAPTHTHKVSYQFGKLAPYLHLVDYLVFKKAWAQQAGAVQGAAHGAAAGAQSGSSAGTPAGANADSADDDHKGEGCGDGGCAGGGASGGGGGGGQKAFELLMGAAMLMGAAVPMIVAAIDSSNQNKQTQMQVNAQMQMAAQAQAQAKENLERTTQTTLAGIAAQERQAQAKVAADKQMFDATMAQQKSIADQQTADAKLAFDRQQALDQQKLALLAQDVKNNQDQQNTLLALKLQEAGLAGAFNQAQNSANGLSVTQAVDGRSGYSTAITSANSQVPGTTTSLPVNTVASNTIPGTATTLNNTQSQTVTAPMLNSIPQGPSLSAMARGAVAQQTAAVGLVSAKETVNGSVSSQSANRLLASINLNNTTPRAAVSLTSNKRRVRGAASITTSTSAVKPLDSGSQQQVQNLLALNFSQGSTRGARFSSVTAPAVTEQSAGRSTALSEFTQKTTGNSDKFSSYIDDQATRHNDPKATEPTTAPVQKIGAYNEPTLSLSHGARTIE